MSEIGVGHLPKTKADRKERSIPSAEFLHQRFAYCDGMLFWKARPLSDFRTKRAASSWNARYAGTRAGSPMSNGYRMIAILNTKFLEHRIIFQMMIRPLSHKERVDHVDQDFTNNRHQNLRACSHAQNLMNQPGRRSSACMPKHVYWSAREKKFKVAMRAKGIKHNIGTFKTLEEARSAAEAARMVLHGEYADHRSCT